MGVYSPDSGKALPASGLGYTARAVKTCAGSPERGSGGTSLRRCSVVVCLEATMCNSGWTPLPSLSSDQPWEEMCVLVHSELPASGKDKPQADRAWKHSAGLAKACLDFKVHTLVFCRGHKPPAGLRLQKLLLMVQMGSNMVSQAALAGSWPPWCVSSLLTRSSPCESLFLRTGPPY